MNIVLIIYVPLQRSGGLKKEIPRPIIRSTTNLLYMQPHSHGRGIMTRSMAVRHYMLHIHLP